MVRNFSQIMLAIGIFLCATFLPNDGLEGTVWLLSTAKKKTTKGKGCELLCSAKQAQINRYSFSWPKRASDQLVLATLGGAYCFDTWDGGGWVLDLRSLCAYLALNL